MKPPRLADLKGRPLIVSSAAALQEDAE